MGLSDSFVSAARRDGSRMQVARVSDAAGYTPDIVEEPTVRGDFASLPYEVTRVGDKVQVDARTWDCLIGLLQDNNTVLSGIQRRSSSSLSVPEPTDASTTCPVCGRDFHSVSILKHHLKTGHAATGRVSCEVCEKTYANKRALKAHMESHVQPQREREYTCRICAAVFQQVWQLGQHMKVVHPGTGNFRCTFEGCAKTYSSVVSRNAHLSGCTSNPNFTWKKCLFQGCTAKFARQYDCNRHMKAKHGWKK
jgi:uncharacterized Zn finger protein (UPF0148 family)